MELRDVIASLERPRGRQQTAIVDAMVASELERIRSVAKEWSMEITAEAAASLSRFCTILLEWNKRVNLTGASSIDDLLAEHLPDSFIAARLISEAASVVDIGSGGGLPGIPLAILRPDCRVTLVEPRGRRVAFLNTASRTCGCDQTRIIQCRSEEIPNGGHDVAMSRATFAPEVWLQLGRELVRASGHVLAFSTAEVGSKNMRLVESVSYQVGRGVPRWAGLFER